MPARVLVAYATKLGSNGEIAEVIAEVLRDAGHDAAAHPTREVKGLDGWDAIILGSAIYAAHWQKDARRFATRFHVQLAARPLWLWSSGPLDPRLARADLPITQHGAEITAELGASTTARLAVASLADAPIDPQVLETHPIGDFRDWEAIHSYAPRSRALAAMSFRRDRGRGSVGRPAPPSRATPRGARAAPPRTLRIGIRRSRGQADLVVDEGVVEPGGGGILAGGTVDDRVHARPVGRGQAHRARLAARVERAALEQEGAQRRAGRADRGDLGMGGGVVRGRDPVAALADRPFGRPHGRAERPAPRATIPSRPTSTARRRNASAPRRERLRRTSAAVAGSLGRPERSRRGGHRAPPTRGDGGHSRIPGPEASSARPMR